MLNKKMLIIRFSSIGDIVLTSPVIRCVKKQLPGIELHYLSKAIYKDILLSNPYIDKCHFIDKSLNETISLLRKENFDVIIDLHHNLRTMIIKAKLGIKNISFNKLNIQKWILCNFKINLLPDIHIVDRYFDTVKWLGIKNDRLGLDYFMPENDQINIVSLPENFRKHYIAFVIGAKFATKKLPLHKMINICNGLKLPIVLLGARNDKAVGDQIIQAGRGQIYNGCGRYSINQSASLIKQAKKVLCFDTGLQHISAAFGKELISIWGNTVPELGMTPYFSSENNNPSHIIEVKNLKCRPCSKIGYKKCPKGHFRCMEMIEENEIIKIVNS